MARLFKKSVEMKKSLWRRAVDLMMTDVQVLAKGVDDETLESLEERLLAADFGVPATLRLVDHVESENRKGKVRKGADFRRALEEEVRAILAPSGEAYLHAADDGPTIYLIVGVNGVGKTTSIAKLAHRLVQDGRSVLVAAGDTFRAGAVEQLEMWAERIGAQFLRGQQGGDPAAVAFDAMEAALARGVDVVLVDTAGRLHTNRSLMEQLRKVDRVIRRKVEGAPHETLMVLDATLGQNSLSQVRAFGEVVDVSGVILTKMDSSARGGIIVALQEEHGLPVKLVGTGEGVDDLETFDVGAFVDGIFE
ncbi:MAG: signal recognition particle-docking protein FtsY [Longimicrobiales bacterium]